MPAVGLAKAGITRNLRERMPDIGKNFALRWADRGPRKLPLTGEGGKPNVQLPHTRQLSTPPASPPARVAP